MKEGQESTKRTVMAYRDVSEPGEVQARKELRVKTAGRELRKCLEEQGLTDR